MYVGYMYGTSGSLANNRTNQTNKSTAASTIESWYTATFNNNEDTNTKDASNNLLTTYINPSAIYCNDRSVGYGEYNTDNSLFYYGSRERLVNDGNSLVINPSLACGATDEGYGHYFEESASIADKFTGSQTNSQNVTIGNGLLGTTPAALITADEIVFAGGVYKSNSTTWYYYNAAETPDFIVDNGFWWTMSPSGWADSVRANVFRVYSSERSGELWGYSSNSIGGIRPVISFKSDVLWTAGTGAPSSPFEVSIQ